MIEIAEALKKQREAKGFTIDDLFQRTRININFLRALESGQFDILPETYVRLFIKKYAQEVGLNVEEILAEYDKNAPKIETPQPPPPSAREINFQPAILIAIGVFIIALLIWQVRQQTNPNTATLLETPPSKAPLLPRNPSTQPTTIHTQKIETPQPIASETPIHTAPINPETLQPTVLETPSPTEGRSASITPPPPVKQEQPNPEPISPPSTLNEPTPVATIPIETNTSEADPLPQTNTERPTSAPEALEEPLVEASSAIAEPITAPPVTPNVEPERLTPNEPTPEAPQVTSTTAPILMPLPVTIAPGNPILLSGIAQQTTQLLVKADGRTLFDGELQVGSRPRWTARDSLELTLSNHNAIALSLQNQPLQFDASIGPNIQISINRTQIRILPSQY